MLRILLILGLVAWSATSWAQSTVNVAFSDAGETKVIATFGNPQPVSVFPYQAAISTSDARYLAFSASTSVLAAVAAHLASGVGLVCSSATALDGTYAVDAASYANLTGAYAGIAAGQGVPGGGSTFNYPDMSGTPHSFTASQFLSFGNAVRNYVYGVYQEGNVIAGGGTPTWPTFVSPSC